MKNVGENRMTVEASVAAADVLERLRDIVLSEMCRRRRRLGAMTPEQERALEELLTSTVEKISRPVIERAQAYYLSGDVEKGRAWCAVFG